MPSSFLSKRLVLAIQRDQIETFGGRHGIRDEALLDSALEQPRATFGGKLLHATVPEQATAYLFHLVNNHAFIDGNKRIAFAATDVFLRINGVQLELSDAEVYDLVLGAATGGLDKTAITRIVQSSTVPM
ncbi:MAG: type II toxin-antitoxin system death-on-curing family toxin [Actinomycetota bacterium]|nr:type II toxin-antitoxin system death-on-curing family toxin [Actinomycetota bacterium]